MQKPHRAFIASRMASSEVLALAQRAQHTFLRHHADEIRHLIEMSRREAFEAARSRIGPAPATEKPVLLAGSQEFSAVPPRSTELRAARTLERLLAQRIRLEELLQRRHRTPAR